LRILPTITPARLAWLETLEREGVADRPKSPVGFHTMRLGWTEWARGDGTETIAESEFDRRFPRPAPDAPDADWHARSELYLLWPHCGEMLTDAGRKILEGARNGEQKKTG
jgi:hypothetical protein